VITTDPREVTIVALTGSISPEDLPKLESRLHLFGKTSEFGIDRAVAAAPL
jgi:hypothetical protein